MWNSLQTDSSVHSKIAQSDYKIVLSTPESFYDKLVEPRPVFKTLCSQKKIRLIAIDEAHLTYSLASFSPAYEHFMKLPEQFEGIPFMALTATATPAIITMLKEILRNPICEIAIGIDKYSKWASQLIPHLEGKAIINLDLIRDVAPLAISLGHNGLLSCSYHGDEMTMHDKVMALSSWKSGEIQVMVCTSAFGMGIDQPDVDKTIRVGVPPSIEQLVQELGRGCRHGKKCQRIVFYVDNDLQHASFWCKVEHCRRQKQILSNFQVSWKFITCEIAGRCRREMVSYFEDITSNLQCDGPCCDVCISELETTAINAENEMKIVTETVQNLDGFGEVKLAQHIRASAKVSLQCETSTLGSGFQIGYSLLGWRIRIRQAWIVGTDSE
ncbi:PREDICTED: putative ATP-dependent DNA helicase Q1 [Amphimedon queenslandica]|uniref:DNA 3'-5' helicase n=1 Tax=Amphimedon queenslandica TaxID=400682 RepID=A0A1X7TQK3_AMPQE|nr:PREDICTED: putative ATP-dependent DNA helicase Q1 [Amphimedon queenslandica]|eukprot:XP_011407008.1 PREDICTED: putative ATP-dependent DNA helicase Q1 [Amphimedon queenslandica]